MTELQCFVYRKRPFLKIDCIPCKTNHFASAQACFEDQRILIVVMGVSCCFKKYTLLVTGEKLNIVCCTNWLCKSNAVHRVLGNQVIHLRGLEHCTHRNVCLTDGRTCIVGIHLNEHLFTVHRLHICNHHAAHDRLNVVDISLTVISERVRC